MSDTLTRPAPKTLDALVNEIVYFAPPRDIDPNEYWCKIIRNYIAQDFAVAYLKASPAELEILKDLFETLTKRGIS